MDFRTYSYRHGEEIANTIDEMRIDWDSLKEAIREISDEDIVQEFSQSQAVSKSLASSISNLMKDRLIKQGWASGSQLFLDNDYVNERRWKLDYSKNKISVEVAFNHAEAIAWNLIKPVLAGETNIVRKAVQTSLGVIVTATNNFKWVGGFDSSIGTFEKHLTYLQPLSSILTVPMIIIGLEAPRSFHMVHCTKNSRKVGRVVITGVMEQNKLHPALLDESS